METRKLSVITDTQCGLVLNRKEARATEAAKKHYKRLNLRSLKEDGHLNMNELDNYDSVERLDEQILTRPNDIIIRLFAPPSPILIQSNEGGLVIPSQLAVIRMKDGAPVLPGYLRWYLSSSAVSNKLLLAESSQIQRSIKIGALSSLTVPIPSLAKQQLIVQVCETGVRRENLYKELIEQEKIYMNGLLQKTIGGTAE